MKTIRNSLKILILLTLSQNGFSDVKLTSAADIVGLWHVDAEAVKYAGDRTPLQVTWEFRPDGLLKTASKDIRTGEFAVDLSYSVEDGLIKKQSVPGRQKFESCTVLRKDATSMDIKCTFLYLFLTRK